MSYQALYRKWRPSAFDEVVGQDAVITTLKNQIKSDRIGHAYLFCGTRGTGKTSAAKIFARAVNCPNAAMHGGNPCNECEVCKAISSGRAMNVFEIDAASNNGVDNIRDIRDQVEYPPVTGRFKVYIIDEVHMLSTGAFNALLKTLEEPPSYVIFILATTDPQKIPATVLSRCQRYDFRRMGKPDIAGHLKEIMEKEGVSVEDRALSYIAEAADGSMRDSLSLLDQCLAYHYGEVLTYDNVLDILGAADASVFSELLGKIRAGDVEGALGIISELVNTGREVTQLINDFIWYLRNVLLAKSVGKKDVLDISDEKYELAARDAEIIDRDSLIYIITSMAGLLNRIRFSSQRRVQLEVEIIRLCVPQNIEAERRAVVQPKPSVSPVRLPDVKDRMPAVEVGSIETAVPATSETRAASAAPAVSAEAAPEDRAGSGSNLDIIRKNWNVLTGELSASNRPLFTGVELKEERGVIMLLFKNKMNYTLAAKNTEENGLIKLRELAAARFGIRVSFMARIAKPGEINTEKPKATNEELAKINFPVSIED
ncbi:MAG: DNA polymerase III subunit gamma/tau [Eubacteriales bacterium]|nr:DNA polymerase III subunit gamma/tau [Eubacteriales bacterium]